MKVSGELFALVNTLANGLSLWLTVRLLGVPMASWKRLLQASLLGTVYANIAFLPAFSLLRTFPFVILSALVMAMILMPHPRLSLVCKTTVLILLCGLMIGGFATWLISQGVKPWLAFGALFLSMAGVAFLFDLRIKSPSKVTMVEISMDACGPSTPPVRLPAMLDTGNQLTDPITGLPVVVASSSSLRPLLPAAVKPDQPETLPLGFRLLRVQTTAGHRMMMCFRPSHFRVLMEGAWHDSQALIAIAPTGYDGDQALVPAALVEAL